MSTPESSKVKFGLKNCHYSIITEVETNGVYTVTYATPVALVGGVSLNMDPEGEESKIYADDRVYYSQETNQGYTGSLEIVNVPDHFLENVLMQKRDADGVLFEHKDAKAKNIALMFELDGDTTKTRYLFYKIVPGRFKIGAKTKTDSTEPVTDTLNIKALEALDTGYIKAKSIQGDAGYDTWYQTVHAFKAGA